MDFAKWAEWGGIIGGLAMPLFNIPLILHLLKHKRSSDYSLTWLFGIWISIILMTPQAMMSKDLAFKIFGVLNFMFFNVVGVLILKYRKNR